MILRELKLATLSTVFSLGAAPAGRRGRQDDEEVFVILNSPKAGEESPSERGISSPLCCRVGWTFLPAPQIPKDIVGSTIQISPPSADGS